MIAGMHSITVENVGLIKEKNEEFRCVFVEAKGEQVVVEIKDDNRNYYFTIIEFTESEGFKIVDEKLSYYKNIMVKKKGVDDFKEYYIGDYSLNFMEDDDLYKKYRTLYDGCFVTEYNFSYYYMKDYIN
jgi:hypothetical protein